MPFRINSCSIAACPIDVFDAIGYISNITSNIIKHGANSERIR